MNFIDLIFPVVRGLKNNLSVGDNAKIRHFFPPVNTFDWRPENAIDKFFLTPVYRVFKIRSTTLNRYLNHLQSWLTDEIHTTGLPIILSFFL